MTPEDANPVPVPVPIMINEVRHRINPGRHAVSELKTLGGVPLVDVLEQVVDGQLVTLPDDGVVHIHGSEIYVSRLRSGGSS